VIYFSAVEGLIDLLSGIEETLFVEEIRKIEIDLEKMSERCNAKNTANDTARAANFRLDGGTRVCPDWFSYGRQYFRVCMRFIQTKGFGFTEIATERI
jgi:hypothetical protein